MSVRAVSILLAVTAALVSPAYAGSLSGTYVGKNPSVANMVQIVESGDHHLTGRYEEFVLQPTGKTVDMNAALTGAVDDQTVVLTLQPSEPFASPIILSGTIQGNMLHLTGGANGVSLTYNLLRSDEADFRSGVAAITEQGNRIVRAKLQADQIGAMKTLMVKLTKFIAAVDVQSPKFPSVEDKYRQMTMLMRRALEREKSIRGDGQASVARNQISVGINQAAIQSENLHSSVQNTFRQFEDGAAQLSNEVGSMGPVCRGAQTPDIMALTTACQNLFDMAKDFQQQVVKFRALIAKSEKIWGEEKRSQDEVVRLSESSAD